MSICSYHIGLCPRVFASLNGHFSTHVIPHVVYIICFRRVIKILGIFYVIFFSTLLDLCRWKKIRKNSLSHPLVASWERNRHWIERKRESWMVLQQWIYSIYSLLSIFSRLAWIARALWRGMSLNILVIFNYSSAICQCVIFFFLCSFLWAPN